jgi:hypothetical protein
MEATTQTTATKPRYVVVRLTDGSTTVLPENEAIQLLLAS